MVLSTYEANAVSIAISSTLSIEYLKIDRVITEFTFKIYMYHMVGEITLYSQ